MSHRSGRIAGVTEQTIQAEAPFWQRALSLSVFLALVVSVVVVSLLLSGERHDPNATVDPPEIAVRQSFFFIEGDVIFEWSESGVSERARIPGVIEVRSVEGGFVYQDGDPGDYTLHLWRDSVSEEIARSGDMSSISSDGGGTVAFSSGDGVTVISLADRSSITYPAADSFTIVTGSTSVISSSMGMVWLRSPDSESPIGSGSGVGGISDGKVLVEDAESYRWVSLTGGMTSSVTPLSALHLDSASPLGEGGTVQTFSEKRDGALSMMSVYASTGGGSPIISIDAPGAVIQACGSPDGSLVAVTHTDDVSSSYLNGYDTLHPPGMSVSVYDATNGKSLGEWDGGFVSWCQDSPIYWSHPDAHVH